MNKAEAHAILNRCKDNEDFFIPLGLTNAALERTGDICGVFGPTLRFDGDEPSDYRPRSIYVKSAEVGFSYSRYLDCSKTEGVTQ